MFLKAIFAAGLGLCAAAATTTYAQEFRFEAVPLFENCGDNSLKHAQNNR